jgi:hypothetical protein
MCDPNNLILAFFLGAWLMYGIFLVMEEVVRRIGDL